MWHKAGAEGLKARLLLKKKKKKRIKVICLWASCVPGWLCVRPLHFGWVLPLEQVLVGHPALSLLGGVGGSQFCPHLK